MTLDFTKFLKNLFEKQMTINHLTTDVCVVKTKNLPAEITEEIQNKFGKIYLDDANYVVFFKGVFDKQSRKKAFNLIDKALGQDANNLTEGDIKMLVVGEEQEAEEPEEIETDAEEAQPEEIEATSDEETSTSDEENDEATELDEDIIRLINEDGDDTSGSEDEDSEGQDDEEKEEDTDGDDEEKSAAPTQASSDSDEESDEKAEPENDEATTPIRREVTIPQDGKSFIFVKLTLK